MLVRDHLALLRHSTRAALLDGSPREAEARLAARHEDIGLALSEAQGFGVFDTDPELQREAFLLSETCRSAALTGARLAREAGADPTLDGLRERCRRATDQLAELARKGASAAELERARAELDAAERGIVLEASRRLGGGAVLEPDLATLARALGPRDAVVAWRRYTRHRVERSVPATSTSSDSLCAFVLRRDGEPATAPRLACVELGPFEPVERAVAAWRASIGTTDGRGLGVGVASGKDVDARGADLGRLVLDPLRGELAGVERLLLLTDDVLHLVPLDALPSGALARAGQDPRATLLGDAFSVETRSTLIELGRAGPRASGDDVLLALGGADFARAPAAPAESPRTSPAAGLLRGTPGQGGFAPLPATRSEVEAIAASFRGSFLSAARAVVLIEEEASCASLRTWAANARILHVATHGWYAPDSIRSFDDRALVPAAVRASGTVLVRESSQDRAGGMSPMLLCGLALAGANLPADSLGRAPGLITAQEIAALDLSNCDLAVLSACETHAGTLSRAGQGVASLQRALQMAGARSVITSLWKVPDETTKDLMLDFYRRLWAEKKAKGRALWEAKTRLREAKDEAGNPRYSTRDWAAWVLTGDPD